METGRRRGACKDVARIIVSIVVMAMLVWIVYKGYRLTNDVTRNGEIQGYEDNHISLIFGVATIVSGLVYFTVGLTVVAELALECLAWLQRGDKEAINNQEKEQTTMCHVIIRASATAISIAMLTWATYHGYKLADKNPEGGMHICLAFLIGFVTIAFGVIYFIIGISIVAESALYLSGKLQYKVIESGLCKERKTDALLAV